MRKVGDFIPLRDIIICAIILGTERAIPIAQEIYIVDGTYFPSCLYLKSK